MKAFVVAFLVLFIFNLNVLAESKARIPGGVPPELMGPVFVLDSSMSIENALPLFFQDEDLQEIKAYFAKRKINISKIPMNRAKIVGDKVYYRPGKFAQLQDDVKLKVNGYISEFDERLTPAKNFIRLFEAFEGHVPRHHADVLRAFLPEAKAVNSAAVAAILAMMNSDPSPAAVTAPIVDANPAAITQVVEAPKVATAPSTTARFSQPMNASANVTMGEVQTLPQSAGAAAEDTAAVAGRAAATEAGASEAAGAATGWGASRRRRPSCRGRRSLLWQHGHQRSRSLVQKRYVRLFARW